jgi:hypothetical protein
MGRLTNLAIKSGEKVLHMEGVGKDAEESIGANF